MKSLFHLTGWAVVGLGFVLSCNKKSAEKHEHKSGETAHAHDEKKEQGERDAKGEHRDEIQLSAEAIDRAGIKLAKVEKRALTSGVAIPAEIQFEPSSTAHVGTLVAGRFTKVAVQLGDRVKVKQLLGVVASGDVSEARSRLEQARARLSAAEAALQRQTQLASEGISAQRALVEAEAQAGELRAEVQGIQRQLSVFGSGRGGELQLVAPIEGVVVHVHATLGETASPEEPAFVVTDPDKVWVRGNVPELEINRVQSGSSALVRLHAFPDLVLRGTVSYVAPSLDEATRSLPIRVTLETSDARLRSGLFGSVELLGGKHDERVVVVPVDATATLDGQDVVFLRADEPNTFRPAPVRLGRRAGAVVEVRAGLKEGEDVVISGTFTLKSAIKSGELSEGH